MPQLMPPVYIQMRLSNCFSSAFREPGGRELFRGDKLGDRAGDSRGDKNGDSSISWSTQLSTEPGDRHELRHVMRIPANRADRWLAGGNPAARNTNTKLNTIDMKELMKGKR
jgi:hypothetical protein